jgi:hypothetical protein
MQYFYMQIFAEHCENFFIMYRCNLKGRYEELNYEDEKSSILSLSIVFVCFQQHYFIKLQWNVQAFKSFDLGEESFSARRNVKLNGK